MAMEVGGILDIVKEHMESFGVFQEDAQIWNRWRRELKGNW